MSSQGPLTHPRSRIAAGIAVTGLIVAILWWQRSAPIDDALVVVAHRGTLATRLTTTGVLRPVQALTYRSPVPGREVEILELAAEGARVNAGDLLVRLDTTETERDLERARQDARQAQLDYEVAQGEAEDAEATVTSTTEGEGALALAESRTRLQLAEKKRDRLRQEVDQLQPLLARGYITREELARTTSELEQAEEELTIMRRRAEVAEQQTHPRDSRRATLQATQKQAQLGRARARLEETAMRVAQLRELIAECSVHARGPGLVVYEEFLSVIPRRKIRIGDRVTPSQGIITIPEVARMLVDASVSEAEVHRVRPGMKASVRAEAFANVALTGTVARVGSLASSSSNRPLDDRRFDLIIELDPTDADLRPQMVVRADISAGERRDVLLIPVNAVSQGPQGFVVHARGKTAVNVRPVVLGESNDVEVEVLSGVNAGEELLLAVRETAPLPTGTGAR